MLANILPPKFVRSAIGILQDAVLMAPVKTGRKASSAIPVAVSRTAT